MKKKNLASLALNKKSISKLENVLKGGYHQTCTPTCTTTALYSQCGLQNCY
ncbi:hypothetical protein H2O64_09110 [Kordia sp. YSTF-M3]|uniref:Natural product n=1 Tax=Kordia aestuariivivens TaxID=2759037 RepID=A0ABR7Q8K9_9FLAO|nr:hypothetical protein [Kordia aestuariivivens]MBC8754828.1 hypothetical protein [Kordia aestuariivivens]